MFFNLKIRGCIVKLQYQTQQIGCVLTMIFNLDCLMKGKTSLSEQYVPSCFL